MHKLTSKIVSVNEIYVWARPALGLWCNENHECLVGILFMSMRVRVCQWLIVTSTTA